MDQPASAAVHLSLAWPGIPAAAARGRRHLGAVAAADAAAPQFAPALTAGGRELFVRPAPTMTGTDPKEHT
jgi:hypothetical protein